MNNVNVTGTLNLLKAAIDLESEEVRLRLLFFGLR